MALLAGEFKTFILTAEQAKGQYPFLFEGDSFSRIPANGNAEWLDFVPDLIAVTEGPNGAVFSADLTFDWHLEGVGYA